MKIAIIGTRGIPANYGGFETFAQELSTRLIDKEEIIVYCPSNTKDKQPNFKGVILKYLPVSKDDNPMKYYLASVSQAIKDKVDIILTCGQGGYAYIPHLWRRKRPIFITNTDGIEHRRTKWNKFVRFGVRMLGEFTSVLLSDYLVADSKGICSYLKKEYKYLPLEKIYTIEYGAENIYPCSKYEELLQEFNLQPNNYFLVVSRLEPENNVSMIIDGYRKSNTSKPLIVVGNLKDTDFVKNLQKNATGANIRFIGGIYNPDKLKALRLYSSAYLHGHSVGGTNPSLLEALGAGNIVIGHDNPFNREVTDNKMLYFSNPEECASAINSVDNLSIEEQVRLSQISHERIKNYYNWDRIASEYLNMFKECLPKSK